MAEHVARPRSALRRFLKSEAAGGIVLMAAAALALIVANSPARGGLSASPAPRDRAGAVAEARADDRPSVDQRRADGGLLPARRAGDQARVRRRAAVDLGAAAAAGDRRRRRDGGAGRDLPRLHRRRRPGSAAAGRSRRRPTSPSRSACWRCSAAGRRRRSSCSSPPSPSPTISARSRSSLWPIPPRSTPLALGAAAAILFVLYAMGKSGVRRLWPYLIGAGLLWYAVLLSGVHATVAGVLAAAAMPIVSHARARRTRRIRRSTGSSTGSRPGSPS